LQHADPITFAVLEGNVGSDARNIHRLAEHTAARLVHSRHGLGDLVHRYHHRGILRRPVWLLFEEAAVDRAGSGRTTVIADRRRRGEHIVAHFLTQYLCLPAEGLLIEARDARFVLVRHFEVDDGIHDCALLVQRA
jgi:hypothetical protein